MADGKSEESCSNFVYVRTFPDSKVPYFAYVTCNPKQSGLHKIVLQKYEYSGQVYIHIRPGVKADMTTTPSPGFYRLDGQLPTNGPTPSFFHMSPGKGFVHINNLNLLGQKYLIQWSRDEQSELLPLDMVERSRNGQGG
jgi:hypothetical protein